MDEYNYIETVLPSGARSRVWVSSRWAVIEANGLVTIASGYPRGIPVEVLAGMAPVLTEAARRDG